MPANRIPIINNDVAIGCRMNGAEKPPSTLSAPAVVCVGGTVSATAAGLPPSDCVGATKVPGCNWYCPETSPPFLPASGPVRSPPGHCPPGQPSTLRITILLSPPTTNAYSPFAPRCTAMSGHDDDILQRVEQQSRGDRQTGPQDVVLVVERCLHADRATRLIDLVVDQSQMSLRQTCACHRC